MPIDEASIEAEPSPLLDAMRRYQEGSLEAFEELYAALSPLLRRYLAARCRDGSAEDLLQETFLQIHRSRRTHRPGWPVEPWALGVARHVWVLSCRRGAREGGSVAVPESLPTSEPSPHSRAESRNLLADGLQEIPEGQRRVFLLHHLWGWKFSEIALRLGISKGSARVRAHRARTILRKTLHHETDETRDGAD